jgi:DHA1 family inner membrane transport protein
MVSNETGRRFAETAALNHTAYNIADAQGAWLGGVAIAGGLGWASTG